LECEIPNLKLYKGKYVISAYLGEGRSKQHLQSVEFVCPFEIEMLGTEANIFLDDVCVYIEKSTWQFNNL